MSPAYFPGKVYGADEALLALLEGRAPADDEVVVRIDYAVGDRDGLGMRYHYVSYNAAGRALCFGCGNGTVESFLARLRAPVRLMDLHLLERPPQ